LPEQVPTTFACQKAREEEPPEQVLLPEQVLPEQVPATFSGQTQAREQVQA